MRKITTVAGVGLAVVLMAAPVASQEESLRHAVWFTVGLGAGWVGIDCPDCGNAFSERDSGLSGC